MFSPWCTQIEIKLTRDWAKRQRRDDDPRSSKVCRTRGTWSFEAKSFLEKVCLGLPFPATWSSEITRPLCIFFLQHEYRGQVIHEAGCSASGNCTYIVVLRPTMSKNGLCWPMCKAAGTLKELEQMIFQKQTNKNNRKDSFKIRDNVSFWKLFKVVKADEAHITDRNRLTLAAC